jgi:hypothetical protein
MITKMAAATAVLVALLGTAGPPACQPKGSSTAPPAAGQPVGVMPGGKACDTRPSAPHVITFAGKAAVEGSTESVCDLPPQQHHVSIFLETKSAGQWSVQPDPFGKTSGNCYDLPGAGIPKTCQWIISRCQPGLWRTRVTVFGYGPPVAGHPGGLPFNFDVPEKPSAQLTCKA